MRGVPRMERPEGAMTISHEHRCPECQEDWFCFCQWSDLEDRGVCDECRDWIQGPWEGFSIDAAATEA